MDQKNQNTISWQAHEFRHYPKNIGWYVTLVSITILVIAFFVLVQSDIFAAVCIGIISLLVIFFSRQTPELTNIELSNKGITFGNLFYPYKQLQYFWIVNNTVILELENQDPDNIRLHLLNHVIEHTETEETGPQRIMHKFKF
jgi:uncharacterized membrane protein YobD (UPF0266 family)